MKNADRKERLTFWKFAYARAAFADVSAWCAWLRKCKLPLGDSVRKAVSVGIVVAYGRPFKQRKAVRIPEDIVPSEHMPTHRTLIEIRDKCVAHKDTDGPFAEHGHVNQLELYFKNGQMTVHTWNPHLGDETAGDIQQLADVLVEKTTYHMRKFTQRHFRRTAVPDGEYRLNLDDNPEDWLERQV